MRWVFFAFAAAGVSAILVVAYRYVERPTGTHARTSTDWNNVQAISLESVRPDLDE